MSAPKHTYQITPDEHERIVEAQKCLAMKDFRRAAVIYEQLLRKNPDCNAAIINLSVLYDQFGYHERTLKLWDQAIKTEPNDALAHYFRALTLLAHKDWARGWEEYKWRRHRVNHSSLYQYLPEIPFYNGEDLDGKLVLVWTEQGIGDEIIISSMWKEIEDRGGKLLIAATSKTTPVFMASFPNAYFITREDIVAGWKPTEPKVDYQLSVAELGILYRNKAEDFVGKGKGWLLTGRDDVKAMRDKLLAATGKERLIGVSWTSRAAIAGPEKSMDFNQFMDIHCHDNDKYTALINLEYVPPRTVGVENIVYSKHGVDTFNDLLGVCHLIEALDEVRTVSNSNAHLAGALGVKTTCILPQGLGRQWYWGIEGDSTPWYDSVKLVRRFG